MIHLRFLKWLKPSFLVCKNGVWDFGIRLLFLRHFQLQMCKKCKKPCANSKCSSCAASEGHRKRPAQFLSTTILGPISLRKWAKLWGFLALHSIKLLRLSAPQSLTAANSTHWKSTLCPWLNSTVSKSRTERKGATVLHHNMSTSYFSNQSLSSGLLNTKYHFD